MSRELGTSLAFDDVGNASEISLQHISPCCYTESQNIYRENFRVKGSPLKICRTMTKLCPLPKHFPTDT